MKQTAVEWLVEQITNKVGYYSEEVQQEIYQQAKQMEKEQIIMAVKDSWYMAKGSNEQIAQEKAKELVNKFRDYADGIDSETDRFSPNIERKNAKQCALIAVNEIIKVAYWQGVKDYWQQIKQEIEKI